MQQINWYLSVFDNHKLMGNKKQIGNNGKPCQRNYRLAFWLKKEVSLSFSLLPFTHVNRREMTSFMSVSQCPMYLTSSAGVQYRIPIFLCHLSRGNVIKWTSKPPICQSLRRKQVSSSERGWASYINISQSSILQAGEKQNVLSKDLYLASEVQWFLYELPPKSY